MNSFNDLIEKIKKAFVEKKWLKWVAIGVAVVLVGVIVLCSLTMCKGDDKNSSKVDSSIESSVEASESMEDSNSSIDSIIEDSSVSHDSEEESASIKDSSSSENESSFEEVDSSDDHEHSKDQSSSNDSSPSDSSTSEPEVCTLKYTLSDNGNYLVVTGVIENTVKTLEIPAFAASEDNRLLPVREIAENAFYGMESLRIVRMANISKIGKAAFGKCVNLHTVELSKSLTFIGVGAFEACEKLKNASFADPNNWYYVTSEDAQSGQKLSASDLSNSSTAANYLAGRIDNGFNNWKKIEK